jgi:hypothetical protein
MMLEELRHLSCEGGVLYSTTIPQRPWLDECLVGFTAWQRALDDSTALVDWSLHRHGAYLPAILVGN